jgi:cytoskeletal protein CcmA (bactofilin family)
MSTASSSPDGILVLGSSVTIRGKIISREDLSINGNVEGTIEAPNFRLTIGPNGNVHADIKSREVIVHGSVHGNIEAADRIEIRKDASLIGDIKTARIGIEDGAYFKGAVDITAGAVAASANS